MQPESVTQSATQCKTIQDNTNTQPMDATSTQCHRGCKDTQGAAAGCAGSGGEWEETAGGQDAQIQYSAKYKYRNTHYTHTQIRRAA